MEPVLMANAGRGQAKTHYLAERERRKESLAEARKKRWPKKRYPRLKMRYSDVVTASVPKFIFTERELDIAIGAPNRVRFEKGVWLRALKLMGKQRCFHIDDIKACLNRCWAGEIP